MAGYRVISRAANQQGDQRNYQGNHRNREAEGGDGQGGATNPTGIASGPKGRDGTQDVANRVISLAQSRQVIGLPGPQILGEIE
jgi:hypothetical protein